MTAPRAFLVATIVVGVFFAGLAAPDDRSGKPEQITCRVLGLFSSDREKDLRAAFEELPDLKLIGVNFADAEITVEFVLAKAFPGAKPEQVVDRLDQKLRSVTYHTFGVKPRRTVPREKLQEVVIPAAGLDCKACCLAAYEAISGLDGVEQATASFKDGRVTALIDPTKTDRAKLEDALRKKGVELGKR